MLRTRMTTLAFILSELFPLDRFRCNFLSALQLEYPLEYNHDTSQLCRTGHEDVSYTKMTALVCILSSCPLDCLSCNALYIEYHQDYFLHETVQLCRRGGDNVSCIKNMAALMFILS